VNLTNWPSDIEREDYRDNCFHSLAHALPQNHFNLFRALFSFIKCTAGNDEDLLHHLALVFGPVVFRPKTTDDVLNMVPFQFFINGLLCGLISSLQLVTISKKGRRAGQNSDTEGGGATSPRNFAYHSSTESDEGFSDEDDSVRVGKSGKEESSSDFISIKSTKQRSSAPGLSIAKSGTAPPNLIPRHTIHDAIQEEDEGKGAYSRQSLNLVPYQLVGFVGLGVPLSKEAKHQKRLTNQGVSSVLTESSVASPRGKASGTVTPRNRGSDEKRDDEPTGNAFAPQLARIFALQFDKYFSDEICCCRYALNKGRIVVKLASPDGLIEKLLDEYYKGAVCSLIAQSRLIISLL